MNDPSSGSGSGEDWQDVWSLYLRHRDVFARALARYRRSHGPLSEDDELELVHDFLVNRAQHALSTFKRNRGDLAGWLYVVFGRFVAETARTVRRRDALLERIAKQREAAPTVRDPGDKLDLEKLKRVLETLSSPQRKALLGYFDARRPSLRGVGDSLGVSRWKAKRLVAEGAVHTALGMGLDLGLDERRLGSLRGGGTTAAKAGQSIDDATLERAYRVLAGAGRSADRRLR